MFLLLACASPEAGDPLYDDTAAREPEHEATILLWEMAQGWEDWAQVEPWVGVQPSDPSTLVDWAEIHLNPEALESIREPEAVEGTVIVRQGHGTRDGENPTGTFGVHWKTAEYGRDRTGWYWAVFQHDGDVVREGEPDGCVECHTVGRDWRLLDPT